MPMAASINGKVSSAPKAFLIGMIASYPPYLGINDAFRIPSIHINSQALLRLIN